MMKQLFVLCMAVLSLLAMTQKPNSAKEKIDDWDVNATLSTQTNSKKSRVMPMATMATAPAMKMSQESLGFSAGGAKDADNFYENIKNGYLPKMDAITYEGVFYDHYFTQREKEKCEALFCPSYTTTTRVNPYTKEEEHYLSVGLNSNIKVSDFERKKLNLVVVLDISGSMSSSFERYHYDKNSHIKSAVEHKKSKMKVASESLVKMIDHLEDEDRLGVVLFDHDAYTAKPLRVIKKTKIDATKKHILDLKSQGGTNWSAGYKEGLKLFNTLSSNLKNPNLYENRVIFLTDAMPNRGELKKEGLFGLVDDAAKEGVYTTFIGIGVDFNNDLVEAVSKTKGANYYAVHSASAFEKRLDDEFDFMVTPLVFDLQLTMKGGGYVIEAVYGSPDANRSTGELMYVNTLFPSKSKDGETKGGVILLKLKKESESNTLALHVNYKDRTGKVYNNSQKVTFGSSTEDSGIKKAILLSDYVTIMKNWLLDMRAGCQDSVNSLPEIMPLEKRCMLFAPDRPLYQYIKTWERRSCALKVSEGYQKIFAHFKHYFETQASHFKNDTFEKETAALMRLLETNQSSHNSVVIDDWKSRR